MIKRAYIISFRATELVAVHIEIVKHPLEIVLTLTALGRAFNATEYALKCFIEVFVRISLCKYITEKQSTVTTKVSQKQRFQ